MYFRAHNSNPSKQSRENTKNLNNDIFYILPYIIPTLDVAYSTYNSNSQNMESKSVENSPFVCLDKPLNIASNHRRKWLRKSVVEEIAHILLNTQWRKNKNKRALC